MSVEGGGCDVHCQQVCEAVVGTHWAVVQKLFVFHLNEKDGREF